MTRPRRSQYPRQESNLELRPSQGRVPPPHSGDLGSIPARTRTGSRILGESDVVPYTTGMSRADDWIRTSMGRFTKAVPFSVEPRRRKGIWRESNPHLLGHSQPCRSRYTTDTTKDDQHPDQESNPERLVRSEG